MAFLVPIAKTRGNEADGGSGRDSSELSREPLGREVT